MSIVSSSRSVVLQPLDNNQVAELVRELFDLAEPFDIELTNEQAEACVRHLLYVTQVNEYMNLTRITDVHEALVLHIIDSLALLPSVPRTLQRFLDMGTGAGFPGIPLGIVSESSGVLLDSVGKKIKAVNAFIEQLGLMHLKGVHARLEEYAQDEAGSFDLVIARAVGSLPLLIEYATPFLSRDGYVLLAKANPTDDELAAGLKVARMCGLALAEKREFNLPHDLGHRTTLLYQRVGNPSIKLPRPVGAAKKNPLA